MIILLGHRDCPGTINARRFLRARGIDFVEKDVVRDTAAREEFRGTGALATPVIIVGKRHLLGFDPQAVLDALKLNSFSGGEFGSASSRR